MPSYLFGHLSAFRPTGSEATFCHLSLSAHTARALSENRRDILLFVITFIVLYRNTIDNLLSIERLGVCRSLPHISCLLFCFFFPSRDFLACSYCSLGKIVISRRKSFLKSFEFYYPNRLGTFKFQIQTVFVLIKPVGRHIIRIFISRYLVSALYII